MDRFMSLRLELWREACRHIEIEQSLERIAPALLRELPIDLLLVRRIDLHRPGVETVACAACQKGSPPKNARSELAPREFEHLISWCHRGEVAHRPAEKLEAWVPGLLPEGLEGDVLAGPLVSREGPVGVVLLVARAPHHFHAEHETLFSTLIEPFTVALENDHRLREISTLREAAEADRLSLLSRLGRSELGETIVGTDGGLRPVLERVDLVAGVDVPVLIFGETGSGKEVIARAIHSRSHRSAGPFLRVNCGAIPPGLIDSELFGHERGSFTGAVGERRGWFERAHGGTLFLDEIGELPLDAQVRLLRVLQDGTLERVGGHRQISVDVRIVAATHRDLPAMILERRFREDLWYRIAVFPIELAPLRDRTEDLPALAVHFALRAAKRFGTPPLLPSPRDLDLLLRYPWPGNVRELAAVMERAVILGNGRALEVERALGPVPPARPAPNRAASVAPPPSPARSAPITQQENKIATLNEAMARHIEAALAQTHGRIEGPYGAAALLDINPHTLRARMRKLRVDWRRHRRSPPDPSSAFSYTPGHFDS
jgi:transcriptional regulator with GAF, ATPase, and Fis domain